MRRVTLAAATEQSSTGTRSSKSWSSKNFYAVNMISERRQSDNFHPGVVPASHEGCASVVYGEGQKPASP
ncbi:hypothetical protein ACFO25_07415 [Paenactinomyces guangxiensis]|uniref:Uncharacterized protein n=1 Tax=Paenactinomyces guangxiensis TaxID=1490290 RepID=A0A7W1WNP1_9BACL|nr:hypothetical protein [Paenactinomyces guangxiensis]MBA4493123.1 hypothetical protein [Paenactinomyces guangxiensis]MBH8590027.1 hypothetical protein [Paenactinomyces guangxiensis]